MERLGKSDTAGERAPGICSQPRCAQHTLRREGPERRTVRGIAFCLLPQRNPPTIAAARWSRNELIRADKKQEAIERKKLTRLAVGPYATVLFENWDSMWLQIQEMLRIEKGGEAQVADELAAYLGQAELQQGELVEARRHDAAGGDDLLAALQRTVKELTGAYALAVVSRQETDRMVCARMGCPLLIGLGEGENFIASDVSAILQATRRVIFLEEGDTAWLARRFDGRYATLIRHRELDAWLRTGA